MQANVVAAPLRPAPAPPPVLVSAEPDDADFVDSETAPIELSPASLQGLSTAVRGFTAPRSAVPRPAAPAGANPQGTAPPAAKAPARGQFRPPQQRTPDVSSWCVNTVARSL